MGSRATPYRGELPDCANAPKLLGTFVFSDGKDAYVIPDRDSAGAKVMVSGVRPIDPTKKRKQGDKVVACAFKVGADCTPAKIKAALHDGLAYAVTPAEKDSAFAFPESDGTVAVGTCELQ